MATDAAASSRVAPSLDGAGLRVAVVCGRFNDHVTATAARRRAARLAAAGVAADDVLLDWVPGAFEIPLAAKAYAESGKVEAVIGLGCVIRGETTHYETVAGECAAGIQRAQLATGVPIVFGVLTTENLDQALARSQDSGGHNVGEEGAATAVEMALLLRRIRS